MGPKGFRQEPQQAELWHCWWRLSTNRTVPALTITLPASPLSVNSQCSTGDRGTRSPKSRMGNRPLQHFPHIWAANAWDGVNRWICSVCIYLTLFSSIWSLTLSPLTHSLICTANAVFQSTGLVSCLSLCCSEDFPPAPPNNFHESDFYPYPPSVLSLGPVLTFKLDKLKVITEWKEQG